MNCGAVSNTHHIIFKQVQIWISLKRVQPLSRNLYEKIHSEICQNVKKTGIFQLDILSVSQYMPGTGELVEYERRL
jgi:hypothetical protein